MTSRPRRLPPSPQERANRILKQTRGAHSAQGAVPAARPLSATRRARPYTTASVGSKDRLTLIWSTFDVVSDVGRIATWGGYGSALDQFGPSVQLSDPATDDGVIYLFGAGLYCVTVQLNASPGTASIDQAVSVSAKIKDRPSQLTIACALRGTDPVGGNNEYHATSATFYSDGLGLSGNGVEVWVECSGTTVSADIGQVTVRAVVQKIIAF